MMQVSELALVHYGAMLLAQCNKILHYAQYQRKDTG